MEELEKAKRNRIICRVAFILISFIIPTVVMIVRFELMDCFMTTETKTSTHLTFYGFIACFLILCLLWKFKDRIFAWIEKWEYSYMKYILLGLSKIWIFIVIFIVIIFTKRAVTEAISQFYQVIEFCMVIICVSECIAYLVVYPLENKYDMQVQRLLRKQERKEDYKEAISEMGE